jgi:Fe-Mn family superoxide dismutase
MINIIMDNEIKKFLTILEGKKEKLELNKLLYSKNDLAPSISKQTLDYHYGELAQSYVDRFNKNEGDDKFNKAGAFLHNILFAQYQNPKNNNTPSGPISDFIVKHYKNFEKFKEEFAETAMKIQGSGWVYLAKDGKIKTIVNHEIKNDIVLLVDWWEHAWALDYQSDKKKYLENQWKIINWNQISSILGLATKV